MHPATMVWVDDTLCGDMIALFKECPAAKSESVVWCGALRYAFTLC